MAIVSYPRERNAKEGKECAMEAARRRSRDLSSCVSIIFKAFLELAGAKRGVLFARSADGGDMRWECVAAEGVADAPPGSAASPFCERVIALVEAGEHAVILPEKAWERAGQQFSGAHREYRPDFLICLPVRNRGRIAAIIYADGKGELSPRVESWFRMLFAGEGKSLAYPEPHSGLTAVVRDNCRDGTSNGSEKIIGSTEVIRAVRGLVRKAAATISTVLIEGETGTGKEIIARAIHGGGPRRERIFLVQNCATLQEALLESELFGHVRGAFTGAVADKRGLFSVADGGTIFLDEVGECSRAIQAKLLRVIEGGIIRPLGSTRETRVDIRIIAATNRRLEEEVRKGNFRKDLFYRLNVIPIRIPPLRDHREDIPLLARHFLRRHVARARKRIEDFSEEALRLLTAYDFRGNVRELENEVERVVALHEEGDFVAAGELSLRMHRAPQDGAYGSSLSGGSALKAALMQFERNLIAEALGMLEGNVTRAARRLGLSRYGLYKKMVYHDLRRAPARGHPGEGRS